MKKKESKTASDKDKYTQEVRESVACTLLSPRASAANAIGDLYRHVKVDKEDIIGVDVETLATELEAQNKAIHNGDLRTLEAMLLDQAHVLQALFVNFTQKMSRAECFNHKETFSRIALRSQNQCRQTLATLAELKTPTRATFVKQQNNAINQQINQDNGRVENSETSDTSANELLEEMTCERMVTRAAKTPIGFNQAMGAMEQINRPEDT